MATYDDLAALLKNNDWQNMDASKLASLLSSSNAAAYSGMTDEEMRKQAENKYASIYNQKKLAAQQSYDAREKSINDQLATLGQSYAKQAKQTTDAVNQALSGVTNAALSRGMGRSSYTTASLGGVQNKGVEALTEILQNRTNAENALAGDLALAKQQLAQTLAGYDVDMETDIQARMDELREADYAKRMEALNMQNQLAMWLAEYNAAYGKKSGSSGNYYPNPNNNPNPNDKDKNKTGLTPEETAKLLQGLVYTDFGANLRKGRDYAEGRNSNYNKNAPLVTTPKSNVNNLFNYKTVKDSNRKNVNK